VVVWRLITVDEVVMNSVVVATNKVCWLFGRGVAAN
jgi:hypothetical protein